MVNRKEVNTDRKYLIGVRMRGGIELIHSINSTSSQIAREIYWKHFKCALQGGYTFDDIVVVGENINGFIKVESNVYIVDFVKEEKHE